MVQKCFQTVVGRGVVLAALLLLAANTHAIAGLDTYSIYLNNKLVLKQGVNKPIDLAGLKLDASHANDNLVIYYNECHAPNGQGTGRTLAVKDEAGNIVKEWRFADGPDAKKGMIIPVKSLLDLKQHARGQLSLVYTAHLVPKGQPLTGLLLG